MKFIKKHLTAIILASVSLVLIILVLMIVLTLWNTNSNDKYGNRLDGIEDYPLSKGYLNDIKSAISKNDYVKSVSINNQGRLVSFIVTVADGTDRAKTKELGPVVIDYFTKDELSFYDIQLYIKDSIQDSSKFPIIGYKHKTGSAFVWTNN